jgi:GNAT superfamily N-acetyltransferase
MKNSPPVTRVVHWGFLNLSELKLRLATREDLPQLTRLMDRAITVLLAHVLNPQEVESSRAIMGLDTLLVDDGTYFVAELGGQIVGCGGWSRRNTLYGGDHTAGRVAALLDPATEPARVRAMYTDPDFTRRGVGKAILDAAEAAAAKEGFKVAQLAATLSGLPLYEVAGYVAVEPFTDSSGGYPVPLVRMNKPLNS